jgi:hypothetical protein
MRARIAASTRSLAKAVWVPCEIVRPGDTSRVARTFYLFAILLSACATSDPRCQKEIDACLKRCEATGGREVQNEHVSPEQSTTYCEDRCQKCSNVTAPSPPPASSAPTYTGNAQ